MRNRADGLCTQATACARTGLGAFPDVIGRVQGVMAVEGGISRGGQVNSTLMELLKGPLHPVNR